MRTLAAWRAALRLARRDAWRHKVRSGLIIAMVAIPVLGLTGADVLARTMQLSPSERVTREIGQADAAIVLVGGEVDQTVDPLHGGFSVRDSAGATNRPALKINSTAYTSLSRRALALLGATSSTVVDRTAGAVSANGLRAYISITQLALNEPVTNGIVSLQSGQMPQSVNQVAVTQRLADRLEIRLGGHLRVGGRIRTVTAVVREPLDLRSQDLFVLPGAITLPQTANYYGQSTAIELVQTSRPVTWAQVSALNAIGVAALSRAAIANPPPGVPVYTSRNVLTTQNAIGIETVAIGMAILEVCLLAGAAFAVGARRQRHDLAVFAAAGGGPADVRRTVLAGGVVLGFTGAVSGAARGLGALTPRAAARRECHQTFGGQL